MLADSPLTSGGGDQLGFAAYANALAGVLDHQHTDTPLTVAISAPWGAGKTSLANMISRELVERPLKRGDRPHIVCWFNAWLHDDAPHLGAAFAAEVANTANRYRAWPRRFLSPLASAMLNPEQRWRRRIFIGLISLAVAVGIALIPQVRTLAKPGASTIDSIKTVLGQRWAPIILLALVAVALWPKVFAAAQSAARFVDDPKSEAADGSMQQVHDQLGTLIRHAVRNPGRLGNWVKRTWPGAAKFVPRLRGRRRLVLIVDDLERCRPPRGVEVCEVASQLLGHPDVVTILVADMSTVAASAEIKYAQLEASSALVGGAYGRAYLQKMVQLQFDLPPASLLSVRRMLTSDIDALDHRDGHGSYPPAPGAGRGADTLRPPATDNVTRVRFTATSAGVLSVLAAVASIVTTIVTVYSTSGQSGSRASGFQAFFDSFVNNLWFRIGAVGVGATIIASGLVTLLLNRRRQTQKIDEEIRSSAAGTPDVESLRAAVLNSDAARSGGAELAGQRFERFLTDDSLLRQQAESEILKFLPGVPRSAKRLANHLRLLLVVAAERKMLGGTPALEAAHLGKWTVLHERWPELGFAVRASRADLAELEKKARDDQSELAQVIEGWSTGPADLPDIGDFLRSDPALAPVAQRLIYCVPATGEAGE